MDFGQESQHFEAAERHSRKILFICGVHRSGTSIVHRCLRAHSQISGFDGTGVPEDEGQHLQTVFPPAWRFGGPGRFGFHPEAHLTETAQVANDSAWDRLWHDWAPHWDLSRTVLVEKSPPNLLRMRYLQAAFPQSHFLAVLRHPIATAYATRAYKRRRFRPWQRLSIEQLLRHWFHCHRIMSEDRGRLARFMIVRFEDFSNAPHDYIANIARFVGLDAVEQIPEVRRGMNDKYFAEWDNDMRSRRFRTRMAALEREFESEANAFGYSLSEPA